MRLNCNKAKKLIKWKSVLKFNEAVEMVANWYSSFYLDPKNIDNITADQIKKFQSLAVKRGLAWARNS